MSDTETKTRRERERKEVRKAVRQAEFAALVLWLLSQGQDVFRQAARGKVGIEAIRTQLSAALLDAHSQAAYYGRVRSGVSDPFGESDQQFGQAQAEEQQPFLAAFMQDVESGRYGTLPRSTDPSPGEDDPEGEDNPEEPDDSDKPPDGEPEKPVFDPAKAAARWTLYALALLGTTNAAFISASPPNVLITWNLGGVESVHCEDCPALAEGSPYHVDHLPTVPGAGQTECIVNCKCFLTRESDGVSGFEAVTL